MPDKKIPGNESLKAASARVSDHCKPKTKEEAANCDVVRGAILEATATIFDVVPNGTGRNRAVECMEVALMHSVAGIGGSGKEVFALYQEQVECANKQSDEIAYLRADLETAQSNLTETAEQLKSETDRANSLQKQVDAGAMPKSKK